MSAEQQSSNSCPIPAGKVQNRRSDTIDVLKGLGIFFVVTNHCFARTTRKFGANEVTDDFWLYWVNRFIHFAVPMFLFIACALLTRSLTKTWDLSSYSKSRWRKNVVPYLIASLGYTLLSAGTWTIDATFFRNLGVNILTGKGYFHLYFTVVLIQAAIAVPILVYFLKKGRLTWPIALATGLCLQLIFFVLQRELWRFERPGSLLVWYCVPVLLGLAVGTDKELTQRLHPHRWVLLTSSILLGVIYSTISALPLKGVAISSDAINGAYSAYSGLLGISFWVLASEYPKGRIRTQLAELGRHSLPLFLIHPLLMHLLGGPRMTELLSRVPAAGVIYWICILVGSFALAKAILKTTIGRRAIGEDPV